MLPVPAKLSMLFWSIWSQVYISVPVSAAVRHSRYSYIPGMTARPIPPITVMRL